MKYPLKKWKVSYATKDVSDKEWQFLAGAAYIIEATTEEKAKKETRELLKARFGAFSIPWKIYSVMEYVPWTAK